MFADFQDTAIATLDLAPIKVKLTHAESGEGWTRDHADATELEYRRFLFLMKKFPNEEAAPTVDVDTFWHYHILDTMKYAADCERVFGYFLHHFPYLGMRGEDDTAALAVAGSRMQELYEQTFGTADFAAARDAAFRPGTLALAYHEVAAEMQAASCTRMPDAAYCTRMPQAAYCPRMPEAAYCTRTPQAAYCTRAAGTAADRSTAKPAYCTLATAAQQSASAADALGCMQPAQIGTRNIERPRLTSVAVQR